MKTFAIVAAVFLFASSHVFAQAIPFRLSITPTKAVGTSSTSGAAAGLGSVVTFTPQTSGTVSIEAHSTWANTTALDGSRAQLYFGGPGCAAPANGAAMPTCATAISSGFSATSATASAIVSIVQGGIITGLSVHSTYWLDFEQNAVTGGTAAMSDNPQFVITEE